MDNAIKKLFAIIRLLSLILFSFIQILPSNNAGTLDLSLNGTGYQDLTNVISSGAANVVYAYPAGSHYEGMLLIGIDNGTTSLIARVNESTMQLDTSFGDVIPVYYVTPNLRGINSISIDASNNILMSGTNVSGSTFGWVQQLSPDAQTNAIPLNLPSPIVQVNDILQQESGRYILACLDAFGNAVLCAFQDQLVGDNTQLVLDTTFNPLADRVESGVFYVASGGSGVISIAINSDDTILVAYSDNNHNVCISKVLANGAGLVQEFGALGFLITGIVSSDTATVRVAIDSSQKIVVATSAGIGGTELSVVKFTSDGGVDTTWNFGAVTIITGLGSAGVTLMSLLQSATEQTILIGYNTAQAGSPGANGDLFAVRLNSAGQLDSTWNSHPTSPDVPGILTYAVDNSTNAQGACISVAGNVWIVAFASPSTPLLIEIVADSDVQQVAQDPLASPAGTLDYTLDPSGALDLSSLVSGTPKKIAILSDGSMIIATNHNGTTMVTKLLATLDLDTSFNAGGGLVGTVTIDNADTVNDLFIANGQDDVGTIYLTGSNGSSPSSMWACKISADGSVTRLLTAVNSLLLGGVIRQTVAGQILVAGHAGSTGIIAAFSSDMSQLYTPFGNNGYYTTNYNSPLYAMTLNDESQIYIAYKNYADNLLVVQRILATGLSIDGTFNPTLATPSCNARQIALELDRTNNQLVTASFAHFNNIYVHRYSTIDGSNTSVGDICINVGSSNITLSNLLIDTDQSIYVLGYTRSDTYTTVVARIISSSLTTIALDTQNYAVAGGTPGIVNIVAGPLTRSCSRLNGLNFMIGAGILDQDRRVYIVGLSGDSYPYMIRLFGDYYAQEVSQAIPYAPVIPNPINPDSLSAAMYNVYWYGNNRNLFADFFAVDFYALVIIDPVAQLATINGVNAQLVAYATIYAGQLNINLAADTMPVWDSQFDALQAQLISTYSSQSTVTQINRFFTNFNKRRLQVHNTLYDLTT